MINFSTLLSTGPVGRLLRLPLKILPKSLTVRILQGHLKGYKWIVGSATHGSWLGSYELPKQERLATVLKENQVFYDIGANVGFYSLLGAKLLGSGQVFAFEPVPENVSYLKQHIKLNSVENISVLEFAISDVSAVLRFDQTGNRCLGHLSESGNIEVQARTLDEFVFEMGNPCPDVIKIDVEGAEEGVLLGASKVLGTKKPVIFLATHGTSVHERCVKLLRLHGYKLEGLLSDADVENTDEIIAFPNGFSQSRV